MVRVALSVIMWSKLVPRGGNGQGAAFEFGVISDDNGLLRDLHHGALRHGKFGKGDANGSPINIHRPDAEKDLVNGEFSDGFCSQCTGKSVRQGVIGPAHDIELFDPCGGEEIADIDAVGYEGQ